MTLGTDEAGRDDFGVVEDEEVVFLEEIGEVPNMMVLKRLGMAIEEQKSGRVAWAGWLGGDLIQWQGIGKKGGEGWGVASGLTGRED